MGGVAAVAGMGLAACGSAVPKGEAPSAASQGAAADEATANGDVLRIGSEIAFPPYEWRTDTQTEFTVPVDGGGFADGFDVTLAKLIGEAMGKEPLFVDMSFGSLIDALNIGEVDLVLSAMGDSAERARVVAFSHSYYDSVYGLMVKADGPLANAKEIKDFADAAVLGQKSSPLDYMIDEIPNVVHLEPVEHVAEMFERLEAGECDAVTVAVETAGTYMNAYPDLVLVVPESPRLDPGFTGTCAALRKDDEATLAVVNEVIDSLSKDELQRLYEEAESRQP